jgi:hypothetical protein
MRVRRTGIVVVPVVRSMLRSAVMRNSYVTVMMAQRHTKTGCGGC